ncbi:MAG: protein kinase [Anaerolineae bacterium]|nr:protein kinase [Anaerolineae bacterium]
MIGMRLGAYEIIEEIGRGGMATVYRAYQPSMDRHVAVKVLKEAVIGDDARLERFQREARLVARLEHPHLLPIYDYNLAHDPSYIVMRYLEGGTLKDVMTRRRLSLAEIEQLMNQVASALDYAHRQGVIHRDVKPSNIMVDRDNNAFLADFGIARITKAEKGITQAGAVVGSPQYMSPEQGMGLDTIDHRADIYALGVMVFEMVTGRLPYNAERPMLIIIHHINDPIPDASDDNPEVTPELNAVIKRALAKQADERYQSAKAFAQALSEAIDAIVRPGHTEEAVRRIITRDAIRTTDPVWQAGEAKEDENGVSDHQKTTVLSRRRASEELEALRAPAEVDVQQTALMEQRRQITVLYVNLAEYVEIVEMEGAEAVRDAMGALWTRFEDIIAEHGGVVHSRTSDTITVLWGVDVTREDDPERATFAALAMRDILRKALPGPGDESKDAPLPMQIALNTGLALLTPVGAAGIYDATGATISLANRLERSTEPGCIRITHDTYRHVRGVFTVDAAEPVQVWGRRAPLPTYVVRYAKPRAFRVIAPVVEGIETPMVGRSAELKLLQDAFYTVVEDGEAQVVTIVGATGLGKSRLLYEFSEWWELEKVTVWRFEGRAMPETASHPYALLRNIFAYRFQIQDSDSSVTVREKMEQGVAQITQQTVEPAAETAHFIGQLIGFDFNDSPYLQGVLGDAKQFQRLAQNALDHLFKTAIAQRPVIFHLEDIHWADESSLVYLNRLVNENAGLPFMLVALARPTLYERRPDWGSGQAFHTRLDLRPLSKRDCRRLVREILQRVNTIPRALRELIVTRAEGIPFYVEELIKMLIDDRVIVKEDDVWRVKTQRLASVRVPSTLVGLLQTRMDGLHPDERAVLQRAAVVGNIFWSGAVEALEPGDGLPIDAAEVLESLAESAIIHRREESVFAGVDEYIFSSIMLHDVVYEGTLTRQRRAYHKHAADWLVSVSGDRVDEYTAMIAEHYEGAGEGAKAAEYFQQLGAQAMRRSVYEDALVLFQRALDSLPDASPDVQRIDLLTRTGEAQEYLGELTDAQAAQAEALRLARAIDDRKWTAEVLFRLAQVVAAQGRLEQAKAYLDESQTIARRLGDHAILARVLYGMGDVAWRQSVFTEANRHLAESLAMARAVGDGMVILYALNRLGVVALDRHNFEAAQLYFEEGLSFARRIGNRERTAVALVNLGELSRLCGECVRAKELYHESLAMFKEIGRQSGIMMTRTRLGLVALTAGELDQAGQYFRAVLEEAHESGVAPDVLSSLGGMAAVHAQADKERAAEWFGLILSHPAADANVRRDTRPFVDALRAELPPGVFEAALERGRALDLDAVVEEILQVDG